MSSSSLCSSSSSEDCAVSLLPIGLFERGLLTKVEACLFVLMGGGFVGLACAGINFLPCEVERTCLGGLIDVLNEWNGRA